MSTALYVLARRLRGQVETDHAVSQISENDQQAWFEISADDGKHVWYRILIEEVR